MVSVFWVLLVISTLVCGFTSDLTRVRKPFMLAGTLGLVLATLLFSSRSGQPTGPAQMTLVLALLGLCIPSVFVPWIAAYTETVEDINPALVATGLAVQVFISRWVAVLAVLALPLVVGDGQGWAVWWGICIAGQVGFLPTILTVAGTWNPVRAARGEAPPHVGSGAGPS